MLEYDARVLKPDDLFSLSFLHDAQFSPQGGQIAYVVSDIDREARTEHHRLLIRNALGEVEVVPFEGNVAAPRWSPDGFRIAFIGTVDTTVRLYLIDLQAGSAAAPLSDDGDMVQGPPSWSPDGRRIACTRVTRIVGKGPRRVTQRIFRSEGIGIIDDLLMEVLVVDVDGGGTSALPLGLKVATAPIFSPAGDHILFQGADAAVGSAALIGGLGLYKVAIDDGHVTELLGAGWYIAAAAWTPDGRRIVMAGDRDSPLIVPKTKLWVLDADGTRLEERTVGITGNVGFRAHHDMPTWATSQDRMLCVVDDGHAHVTLLARGCAEIHRIALAGPVASQALVRGERSCLLLDIEKASGRLLYAACDLHRPWELLCAAASGDDERQLTDLNAAVLARWPRLETRRLTYAAPDGTPLEGWCLARQDRPGPQPMVMFIHGGPYIATGHAFRYDLHLLAANGFSVMTCNFRGSSGYGEPFMRAMIGDWGARAYGDHIAAMDAAVAAGLADPERLGVWGASHGGFATCWIVGHTDRFKAAVAESAATNFVSLYYLSDAPELFTKDLGGRPDEIPDIYRSRSPLTYAPHCRTPTLMLHGEEDLRCPIAEAEQFYRALKDVGCDTELVRIAGMDHMGDSMGPLSAREEQNEALLDWFERHL